MKIYGDTEFRPLSVSADVLIGAIKTEAELAPETVYECPEHQAVNEDGSRKDVTCYYVHTDEATGEPVSAGCLIGKALHRIGVPLAELAKHEGKTAYQVIPKVLSFDYDDIATRETAAYFAADVQARQDRGSTWSSAVQWAADVRGVSL